MSAIRYGSVCSGIEAASVAWEPLGWRAAFLSEIEKFPSAVLAHHHPDVPNRGDMTKYKDWPDDAIDLLVGGTPCQSFSIAGLRQGLADPRGNLMLTYLAIARRYQPRWLVWENVPGVLSSANGRDFATFIRGLEELGYHAAWRVLDAQFVRVDGFGRAVPQRRRRVFVVGYLGDWRRAAAVLLEPEGMQGDSAPRRQAGQGIAPTISARPTGGGGLGTDFDLDGGLIQWPAAVSPRLDTYYGDKMGLEDQHVFNQHGGKFVPAFAFGWQNSASQGDSVSDVISPSLDKSKIPGVGYAIQAGALRENPNSGPDGIGVQEGLAYTLEARAEQQAVAHADHRAMIGVDCFNLLETGEVAATLATDGGGSSSGPSVIQDWAVRRLTPTECERLQGFPDGYTDIPWRGKPNAPDGPRYKALGNSMAVNCMRWLGRRIEMVEALSSSEAKDEAA